jgi:glutathione S-transferase
MSKTCYKLIYFPLVGRAGTIRLLFDLAEQHFDELVIQERDWLPVYKSKQPFHQVPVLEVTQLNENSGTKQTQLIAQSNAIERYLARKFNSGRTGRISAGSGRNAQRACNRHSESVD